MFWCRARLLQERLCDEAMSGSDIDVLNLTQSQECVKEVV